MRDIIMEPQRCQMALWLGTRDICHRLIGPTVCVPDYLVVLPKLSPARPTSGYRQSPSGMVCLRTQTPWRLDAFSKSPGNHGLVPRSTTE